MTALRLVDDTDANRALIVCTQKELAEALFRATDGAITVRSVVAELGQIRNETEEARTWVL